ncbi:ribonuclease H-like domain-containing protein [Mycena galericulata]|nr:ribonuclease H-like domain-containing protein [Mycena galericulata]
MDVKCDFHYITRIREADHALKDIVEGAVGFDSEHADKKIPSVNIPTVNPDDPDWVNDGIDWEAAVRVCIVQIAIRGSVFVINLKKIRGVPKELRRILESEDILKVGCGFANDGRYLSEDLGVEVKSFVEVGMMVKLSDPERYANHDSGGLGLDVSVMHAFGQTLDKGPRNQLKWDGVITEKHIIYAGLDAQASLDVFEFATDAIRNKERDMGRSIPKDWYSYHFHNGKPVRMQKSIRQEYLPWSAKVCPWYQQGKFQGYYE